MLVTNQSKSTGATPIYIKKNSGKLEYSLNTILDQDKLKIYRFETTKENEFIPSPVEFEFKVPAINVKGVWRPTTDFSKSIEPDWELENHKSRISIDAPVILLFDNNDENVLCFSCSNAINSVEMATKYREEDNCFYCRIIFFTECKYPIKNFSADIRLDYRKIHFSQALGKTAKWWETYKDLNPITVPEIAKKPLYSTWYQFHQSLSEDLLLKECRIAKRLGFEAIIIDDGWQTNDSNRGYDFTGDWIPERFPDIADLVKKIQDIGMKVGLWYSVPFCGKKSSAYQKFKGKFLTENHRWAPVFDPRYPEVRDHLVNIYTNAVRDWKLNGLKLDFIDEFKSYPETDFNQNPNRDYQSINKAVERLLSDMVASVKTINPDIFIEFRQKYTGPAIRKFGNMLRAFDCPGDYTLNRIRITDIRMLAGNTAVHADMVKWNFNETVEDAALHYINTLFGVPQISVMLHEAPKAHVEMVQFYTAYWKMNSDILLSGEFLPSSPLANYPIQQVSKDDKLIISVYENQFAEINKTTYDFIDIVNAKSSTQIVLLVDQDMGGYDYTICDCSGNVIIESMVVIKEGINRFNVPKAGMLQISRLNN